MTLLLVSVVNEPEANLALDNGADIIDLKDPSKGALGALQLTTTQQIIATVNGQVPVSATIGDLPLVPAKICTAVDQLIGIGVDYVKIGLFEAEDYSEILASLRQYAEQGAKLIAVLLAETSYPCDLITQIRNAGFVGIMLDTASKDGRSLFDHMKLTQIVDFVSETKGLGLFVGVAGSLNVSHVPIIKQLSANYAGFRGGLCAENNRLASLSIEKLRELSKVM